MAQSIDERLMRMALSQARKGLGLTSPNPTVGALLAARGKILSRGHHRGAGLPHAEIECLRKFDHRVHENATLYVTLEPCSTVGRTGACTDQIIASRVKRVVIGAIDPNPRHSGRGIELLRTAGLEVEVGVLSQECASLNEAFNKWIVTEIPFVVAKCGMTLDGRLTRPPGESRWITGTKARSDAQALRAQVDAILVGAETVRKDNPRLTVRTRGALRQPLRVVLTRSKNLPASAHLFTDRFAGNTLIYRNQSLAAVLRDLGRKNVTSVMIEGGGDVLSQALDGRTIDKVQIYLGKMITGGPVVAFAGKGAPDTAHALRLRSVSFRQLNGDVCITGYPEFPEPGGAE